jgi:UDP-GlcNAc:undecaprenyl-phosphate GlcNAc-1-phosphate transferase
VWNRPPARIYLGDAGSYLVGATLALLATTSFGDGGSTHVAAASALLVAVPICDTTIAILRRWRAKRPLLSGDRGHVYDQLVDRGLTPGQSTWLCIGAQAVLVAIAIVVASLGDAAAVVVTTATTIVGAGWAVVTFTSPASWTR